MSALHVMVGLPGSGKSTLAHQWLEYGFVDEIVSSDELRGEFTGDQGDISADAKVWPEFHHRIKAALEFGYNVVADATHLTKRSWKAYDELIERDDVVAHAHVCIPAASLANATPWLTGEQVAQQRNLHRALMIPPRVVPPEAMQKMLKQWTDFRYGMYRQFDNTPWAVHWHRT